MNRKNQIQKNKPSLQLAKSLQARLFDKGKQQNDTGFNYITLPSVKRQIANQIQQPELLSTDKKNTTLLVTLGRNLQNPKGKIIKEQSTVLKKHRIGQSKTPIEKIPQDANQQIRKNSLPNVNKVVSSSRLINYDSKIQLKIVKNAYRVMSNSTEKIPTNPTLFSNIVSPQSGYQLKNNKHNDEELKRTRVLMDRMSGKNVVSSRPQTAISKQLGSQKLIKFGPVVQEEPTIQRSVKPIDRYIELILKNVAHVDEFIYLKKSINYEEDPYDLEVIDYTILKKQQKNGLKDYYTISRKGLCYYYQKSPVQFQSLNSWLIERNTFDKIKQLSFFKKFRKWKTLKMWNKIILRQKIILCSQALNQKLFFLNQNLRKVILEVRQNVLKLQDLKLFNYKSNQIFDDEITVSLDKFSKIQKKNSNRIKQKIINSSNHCRQIVRKGFKKNIQDLRIQNTKPILLKRQQSKKNIKNYSISSKQSAYQKLQFSDNMDYQLRSNLRNECIRFLRFSYLIDFLTMSSLKQIYLGSLTSLKNQITTKYLNKQVFINKQNNKQVKSTLEPIFLINLILNFHKVKEQKILPLQPFILPPTGTSKIEDFKILGHVNLKVKNNDNFVKSFQMNKQDQQEVTKTQIMLPQNLSQQCLQLDPPAEKHCQQLISIISQGVQYIQYFQRWSKHPQMKIYIDILQEWDDKIFNQPSQDVYLHPKNWLDSACNETTKVQIKKAIMDSFNEVKDYINKIYEKFLLMYWQDKQIDQNIFTNPLLSNPIDSIKYSMQHLIYQKQLFQKQLPINIDKQLLRIKALSVKKQLQPLPNDIFQKIYKTLPNYVQQMAQNLSKYLIQNIKQLKAYAYTFADYQMQMNNIQLIDAQLPNIKQKATFIYEIIKIMENLRDQVINLPKQKPKQWRAIHLMISQLIIGVQNALISADEYCKKNAQKFKDISYATEQVIKTEAVDEEKECAQQAVKETLIIDLGEDELPFDFQKILLI